MCILCDHATLEILTTPLERFAPGQLGDAVRTARDAAGPGVLDYAEAVLRGDAPLDFGPDLFSEVVVSRALEAGVLTGAEAYAWGERLSTESGARDPRVQAFLSTCAEIVDEYRLLVTERRVVLERFLEVHGEGVRFSWLGRDGELWFEFQGECYAALAEDEAIEIVERELSTTLNTLDPEVLLRYTNLPDAGLEVLAGIQAKPEEVANSILTGMIDLPALADDRVRALGYAPFLRDEEVSPTEDLRFGEWIVVRAPVPL